MSASSLSTSSSPTSAMSVKTPLILGSSSKWRRAAFTAWGLEAVETLSPDIDEYSIVVKGYEHDRIHSPPAALCTEIATQKALALKAQLLEHADATRRQHYQKINHLIICSDQVAFYTTVASPSDHSPPKHEIREKPQDAQQCQQWLAQYVQQPVQVCTAIVIVGTTSQQIWSGHAFASQKFKQIPVEVVDQVIQKKDILSCAGGFMIDERKCQCTSLAHILLLRFLLLIPLS